MDRDEIAYALNHPEEYAKEDFNIVLFEKQTTVDGEPDTVWIMLGKDTLPDGSVDYHIVVEDYEVAEEYHSIQGESLTDLYFQARKDWKI